MSGWKLLLLCIAAMLLAGCTDVNDVNRRVLVVAIGIDRAESGSGVEVTVHQPSSTGRQGTSGAGGGVGGSPASQASLPLPVNHSAKGTTIAGALEEIRSHAAGELFLGAVRLVAFGEELAREGVKESLDFLLRQPHQPTDALVVVVSGRAKDFLQSQGAGDPSPALHLSKLFSGGGRRDVRLKARHLFDLFTHSFDPGGIVWTPLTVVSAHGPFHAGLAILKEGRLVRTVSGPDVILLNATIVSGSATIEVPPLPGGTSPLVIEFKNLHITSSWDSKSRVVPVSVHGAGYLSQGLDAATMDDEGKRFTRHLESVLIKRVRALLGDLYASGLDVLHLAEMARRRSPNGKLPTGWEHLLPQLSFDVEANLTLLHGRRGLYTAPSVMFVNTGAPHP